MSIKAGSTPKYLVRIKDETGIQLDPENLAEVIEVKIWIYNSITGTDVAKFYLNTLPSPSTGWRKAYVKQITPTDKRILFTLTADETNAAKANKNDIQIEVVIPDTDFESGNQVIIQSGRFVDIKSSKS
jgi:hypothetical protein